MIKNVDCKVENDSNCLVAGDIKIENTNFVNMWTGTDVTIKELAETVAKTVGFNWEMIRDTDKPKGTPRKLLDVSILERLGRKYKVDLKEGVKMAYEWYCKNKK